MAALERLRVVVKQDSEAPSVTYDEIEEAMGAAASAIERSEHEIVLRALDIDAPEVLIDGERYRRVLRGPGPHYTMAGEVRVELRCTGSAARMTARRST